MGVHPEGSNLKQMHWLVSIGYKRGKDDVVKLLNLAVDAAGSLFEQTFTSENDYDFPRTWAEVDFEGKKVFVQYSTVNTELEKQADQLLGVTEEEKLTGGDWTEEDEATLQEIKKKLGVDDEDEDNEEEPNKNGVTDDDVSQDPRRPRLCRRRWFFRSQTSAHHGPGANVENLISLSCSGSR